MRVLKFARMIASRKPMHKNNPKNERIKRRYLAYLEEAKRMSSKSADQVAAAIARFHIEQACSFKRRLNSPDSGKPLAKATVHSRLMALKAFFHWLAGQPGYKSRISYSDAEYFNPSANDGRIATAMAVKGYRYDSGAARNMATKEITDDLICLGLFIDEHTVRKWLREAAELMPRSGI